MEILTDKRSKIQPFHLFLWQKKAENTTQKESQVKDNSQRRQPRLVRGQQWKKRETTIQKESQAIQGDQKRAFFSEDYSQQKAENTTQKESQAKDNSQRRQPKMCKHSYVVIQSDRRLPQTLQATQLQMPWLLPKHQAFTWNFNAEATAPQASVVLLAVESLSLGGVV